MLFVFQAGWIEVLADNMHVYMARKENNIMLVKLV